MWNPKGCRKRETPEKIMEKEDELEAIIGEDDVDTMKTEGVLTKAVREDDEDLKTLKDVLENARRDRMQEEPEGDDVPEVIPTTSNVLEATGPAALGGSIMSVGKEMETLREVTDRYLSPDELSTMTTDDVPRMLTPVSVQMRTARARIDGLRTELNKVEDVCREYSKYKKLKEDIEYSGMPASMVVSVAAQQLLPWRAARDRRSIERHLRFL